MRPRGSVPAPSRRLRALVCLLRVTAKPALARMSGPEGARRAFGRAAEWGLLRRPPFVLHLVDDGAPAIHWVSSGRSRARGVILYLHGGAYVAGSPATHEGLAARLSRLSGVRVALPAYRLAPDHPAPAAFDVARAAHAALRARGYRPGEIVLAGDSAGGGLALALLADLCARGEPPAGVIGFSPWVDLTLSGASLRENGRADPLLPAARAEEVVGYVRGALAADDPRLSPLFARFDRPPPVMIEVGETEILRDDALRMAERLRAAGGEVRLGVRPLVPHAWPLFDGWFPEARQTLRCAARFVGEVLPRPRDRS
jgi:acetyl esterase/lipase